MKTKSTLTRLLCGSATFALAATAMTSTAQAQTSDDDVSVVPNEDTNSEEIVDTEGEYDGVGVVVTNVIGQGGVGICTGSLINPRTVLFAAHCVNDRPASDYGTVVRGAVGFNFDALPGLINWFGTSQSNPDLLVYNINSIAYDPRSTQDAGGLGFIEADIALATLDTPAVNIPTWALLFSPLPAPDEIDPVTGTGYNVDIVGYGGTGTATGGSIFGIDFRRRAAENILGGLNSLDDRNAFLFGSVGETFPQNLYVFDFDAQDRNSPEATFDINVHRDDARPNEGTTAGGDSGGPLILDAENNTFTDEDLVIGVLSGGSRFFGPQPFSSIGTTSFYQPLFLYWQYIAENNPYRYVGTVGGDGNWEDASHWQTLLDPGYRIIDETGAIVNGIPDTPELGPDGTEGDFGQICVEFGGPFDVCTDTATGEVFSTAPTAGTVTTGTGNSELGEVTSIVGNNRGWYDFGTGESSEIGFNEVNSFSIASGPEFAQEQSQETGGMLPMPTLANGLPNATGFVPDNIDPVVSADPTLAVAARYFDVTLGGEGTTTLSSEVTIDRLTIRDAAGLAIAGDGDLTSLINISQFGGMTTVDGVLTTPGDYTLFGGILGGTGTVETPFLTTIMGAISPGEMGTINTLTIDGNLILSSGATILADINGAGDSDLVQVTGAASLGGIVGIGDGIFNQVNNGQTYTILTADGGVSGEFQETDISAILSQTFDYTDTSVLMTINAASYFTAIDQDDPIQTAYAQLFDQNRTNPALADIFALDFADAETIQDTFTRLAPVAEGAGNALTQQSVSLVQNFNDQRLREADRSRAGGTIAVTGAPLESVQMATQRIGQPIGAGALAIQGGGETTEVTEANLPEDLAVYLAGGAIVGDADSLPGFAIETPMDGYFLSAGLEYYTGANSLIGFSGYYSSIEADAPLGQEVESKTIAASIYGRHQLDSGLIIEGQATLGQLSLETERTVNFLGTPQELESESDDMLFSTALSLSYDIASDSDTFSPMIEARYARVDLGTTTETGGPLALQIDRDTYESSQLRGGLDYERQGKGIRVNATAQLVWEFEDGDQLLDAQFASGTGPTAPFLFGGNDSTWAEIGAYATIGDGPFTIGLGADTTIGRDSANTQVYRADATFRF